MNLQDCVWEIHYQIIMRTILQEKVTVHCNITIAIHNFLMLQAMKITQAKAAVDQEWKKFEKIPAWDLTRVRRYSSVR